MGVNAAPDVAFVRRWDKGIPHYVLGHMDRVRAIFDLLGQRPGLHAVCNAYHGIAMNDCTRNGRELSAQILAQAG
jgi:oxygen-dependent protoporphyrinogen oxidase